ncbi:hypothetical protein C8K30_10121 [Promicromonospora sp. AC04]|uniref:hypothetical protein n=1 Tax=Promicromonospora sp. AC04 TaxID=2135723 RepID=UPI000D375F17|nr:hypothetical protein [Promicromonospora sp. AC04]PUB31508.1 hypothetical protein C8K30_10121 [Promicromonospora sp. AC04]
MLSTSHPVVATVGVIASVVAAIGLSGCSGQADAAATASPSVSASVSPSPTSSPSPANPAEAAKQERVDDALQRYEEYRTIDEKHQKAGTNGYEELALYLGHPDILNNEYMKWEYITEYDYKMVGDRKPVVSVVNAKYDGDPLADTISGHRVHLDLCIDATGADIVDADGEVVPVDSPDKYIEKVLMQGQPSEKWTIVEVAYTKKQC